MKKVLLLNAHPDFNNPGHATNELLEFTREQLTSYDVTTLNIYDEKENVLPITAENFEMWATQPEDYTDRQKDLINYRDRLIDQWIDSDVVFIYEPLHNYGITSKLKEYFDNILLLHKTFLYTEQGSVGLLDNSKRVVYVEAAGSDYSRDLKYIHQDLAPMHVRSLLNFMGISEMDIVRAQGLSILGADTNKIMDNAKSELKDFIETL